VGFVDATIHKVIDRGLHERRGLSSVELVQTEQLA
jgi:hypothetical protein